MGKKRRKGQTPSIPRKGTETHGLDHPYINEVRISQTPSIPRKGTETDTVAFCGIKSLKSQTPSIPRKGTETLRYPR